MPIIRGPAGMDPALGKMRTIDIPGGTGGGGGSDYTFNSSEFTVSIAGLVSLNEVPGSKVTGSVSSATNATSATSATSADTAVTAAGLTDTAVAYRLNVSSGAASFNPYANIVNATGATVTLVPDTAYKIQATTSAVTLDATVPPSGQWAYEGHAEIFVAGTGAVQTTSNVVLANALEPDAVNNCTVRFHDGLAIISVEDHVAGYIVTTAGGTASGSLYYGLATATNEYISVDASLNGQTLNLAVVTTRAGEKHVVGNGYAETIVSGGISCTSKTTFSNLSMQDVVVNGGTLTLGDVNIPSGSTVALNGGGLAVEKVTGDGGVIALGNTHVTVNSSASASGCIFSGGSTPNYGLQFLVYSGASFVAESCSFASAIVVNARQGAVYVQTGGSAHLKNCVFSDNATRFGGTPAFVLNGTTEMIDCIVSENIENLDTTKPVGVVGGTQTVFSGCSFALNQHVSVNKNGVLQLSGSNTTLATIIGSGSVLLASGAIVNLTGNTNTTPIALGGGVVVSGGCTVINSAGASVSIAGGTYTRINKDGTTE